MLTLIKEKVESRGGSVYGLYKCECGKEKVIRNAHVRSGRTVSCGCAKSNPKHGMSHSSEYVAWDNMIRRCDQKNKDNEIYSDYAGRGIAVCDRWKGENGFVNFLADMGTKPFPEASIDREDNDKGYCPSNCSWEDRSKQSMNRRASGKSKYLGVSFEADRNKWLAEVTQNRKRIFKKRFDTELEAAKARNEFITKNNLRNKLNKI